MRPTTILLAALTVAFGTATVVLAVLVGPDDARGLALVLRLGGLVTIGFGAACVIGVVNRRRRERLRSQAEAHPGTEFVNAHATDSTGTELAAWSPGLTVRFPCDLGFDRSGLTAWSTRRDGHGTPIAGRQEIVGFDVFDDRTPLGSTSRWGIVLRLAPRSSGPGTVHLWLIDGGQAQDEYAMRRTITRIESALRR